VLCSQFSAGCVSVLETVSRHEGTCLCWRQLQAHDGSYDAFIEQFKGINRSGLGYIGIKEFAEHMLATTTGSSKAASR
jgi:hypothetical protein